MAKHSLIRSSNKNITAYDLFGKKHKRNLKNFKFRVSVYGILIENNQILLQRHPQLAQFCLPGGGIELEETIVEGLSREFEEETGIKIKPTKLLGIEEAFFTHEDEDFRNILIFYEVEKIAGELSPLNKEDSVEARFIELQKLREGDIQRIYWNIIKNLKKQAGSE
jgi:ADP-ribose pyrophosphatase YjhB (NUDIX family)